MRRVSDREFILANDSSRTTFVSSEINSPMNYVLGSVFLLCLMLLVMIFGEKLSILGAFHGRWISALAEGLADLWDFVCLEVDRAWGFVLKHLSWVLAVASGVTGVVLVTWMIFGGVADHAAADLAAHSGHINAGGVLDRKTKIDANLQLAAMSLTHREESVPHLIRQVSSPNRPLISWDRDQSILPVRDSIADTDDGIPSRPEFRFRDFGMPERNDWSLQESDSRDLETLWPELLRRSSNRSLDFARWVYEYDGTDIDLDVPAVESLADSTVLLDDVLKRGIDRALEELEFARTDWRKFDPYAVPSRRDDEFRWNMSRIPEATSDEVEDLESGVRVIAGTDVSESELRVETQILETGQRNEVEIEVSVTNQSQQQRRMSGLVVRERLPQDASPTEVLDNGVFRDSTVTWAIDELRPRETRVVRVRVRTEPGRTLAAHTEVSAVAAVSSQVQVLPERRRRTDLPARAPKVELRMGSVPPDAQLAEKIEVTFELSNTGEAAADDVVLRVELPPGLDHFTLKDSDIDRNVFVRIRDLKAGETRSVVLRVRPLKTGSQTAVYELLQNRRTVVLKTFSIFVLDEEDDPQDLRPLLPSPDRSISPGS